MVNVRTRKQVVLISTLITLTALVTTATFVHFATHRLLRGPAYDFAMLLATGLPLIIATPIALIALSMARTVTLGLDKIESFVKFDALSGVLARSYFTESVRARFGEGGAFMLLDADHFKKINDGFGHDVGDEALRTIGRVLNAEAPHGALVGRIGGEEFGIFLPGATDDVVIAAAERICTATRAEGRIIADKPVNLTLSIGIAMIERGSTLSLIFKEADELLYCAKSSGRDCYVLSRNAADPPVQFRKRPECGVAIQPGPSRD